MPRARPSPALLLALAACSGSGGGAGTGEPAPGPDPSKATATYHAHVRPIIDASCLACHTGGGIGPFALGSYEEVRDAAALVVTAVEDRRMPPWLPDPSCRHFKGERALAAEDIQTIRRWFDEGRAEGDPADYVPRDAGRRTLEHDWGTPTMSLRPDEAYTPSATRPDDYRCFPLEHDFERETYVRRAQVVPDRQDLVHHVIVYLIAPELSAQVDALDASEPGPGYTCFGGPGLGTPTLITGWTPGADVPPEPSDAAIRIPPGGRLVMQMHYNVLQSSAAPDRTGLELWLTEERPGFLVSIQSFPNLGIEIPAGEASSKHTRVFTNNSREPWVVVGNSPHMHLLGERIRMTALLEGGRESCIVDIPRWDFGWQQGYAFLPGEELVIQPGERVRLECEYDNSAENQPVVNGVRRESQKVTWGEGTLDEMCLDFLWIVRPWSPLPDRAASCPAFQPCYDACRTSPFGLRTGCLLQCGARSGMGCLECSLPGLVQCALPECPGAIEGFLGCLEGCQREADASACVASRCQVDILTFDGCVDPLIAAGKCDFGVAGCGVRL